MEGALARNQSNIFLLPIPSASVKPIIHSDYQMLFYDLQLLQICVHSPHCQSYMAFKSICHFMIIMLQIFQALILLLPPNLWHFSFLGKQRREHERRKRGRGQTHAAHQGTAAGSHVLCWTAQLEPVGKLFEKWQPHFTGTHSSLPSSSG